MTSVLDIQTVEMYLSLVLATTVVLSAANPFHKYPFVFLLDVGNEELEKTNTEQIRLTIPGGSLAIRYPAIGNGGTISHVRVSGIDFGTDLKASIYDGGPGYDHVVLVFTGKQGAPYDAVVTIQTVPDNTSEEKVVMDNKIDTVDDTDPNDSAEDTSDSYEVSEKTNSELMSSSSNYYSYIQNEVQSDSDNNLDIHKPSSENPDLYNSYYENVNTNDCVESEDNSDISEGNDGDSNNNDFNNDEDDGDDSISEIGDKPSSEVEEEDLASETESQTQNDPNDYEDGNDDPSYSRTNDQTEVKQIRVDSNLYDKYKALMPHLFDPNVKVYPQNSYEVPENEPTSNDEEVHNDANYNSNDYFDSDDSAVAY